MDKKELMAEYNRAVLFGEIYDSKPATQKGQSAVRIGRGKNAGKFFIRGGKGGASKPKATQIGSKPISEAGKPKAKKEWEISQGGVPIKVTKEQYISHYKGLIDNAKETISGGKHKALDEANRGFIKGWQSHLNKVNKPTKKAVKGKTAKPKAAKKPKAKK